MDPSSMFAGLVWGSVGLAAVQIGRRRSRPRAILIGLVLIVLPWLVEDALFLWLSGAALTGLIFWPV